jgi:hypothetical protein
MIGRRRRRPISIHSCRLSTILLYVVNKLNYLFRVIKAIGLIAQQVRPCPLKTVKYMNISVLICSFDCFRQDYISVCAKTFLFIYPLPFIEFCPKFTPMNITVEVKQTNEQQHC